MKPLWRYSNIYFDDWNHLFDLVFQHTYWTHLHKCFTDSRSKELRFRRRNARVCAGKWLGDELKFAEANGAKFVVTLGTHVSSHVASMLVEQESILDMIELPHRSGQNNAIWYRNSKVQYAEQISMAETGIQRLLSFALEATDQA